MDVLYNPHFGSFFECQKRYAVLWGGAGSSKSYSAAQKLVSRCMESGVKHKFLVLRKYKTTIEGSVFNLIREVIDSFGIFEHVKVNNTKMDFTFFNGNEIVTSGLDDVDKLKSIHGITGVWMEEADQFEEYDLGQVNLRLRGRSDSYKQIIITFNPVSEDHWLKRKFFDEGGDNIYTLWSNYKHNLYLDKEYISVLEREYLYDPNLYRIYVLGHWGRERTGGEFYAMYNADRNLAHVKYDPSMPIHLSFDFNINPYMPLSLWQVKDLEDKYQVRCFREIALENPRNSTEEVCKEFKSLYDNHDLGVFIYGDASGRVRSTNSRRHNYDVIENELRPYLRHWSWRVPKKNPGITKRRDFVNKCLGGGFSDIEVVFDHECKYIIGDMDHVLEDIDGKKHKPKAKNKAGVPYEKYGHFSDTLDYLLCELFAERFATFGIK